MVNWFNKDQPDKMGRKRIGKWEKVGCTKITPNEENLRTQVFKVYQPKSLKQ